jgi:HEAT repeat protein
VALVAVAGLLVARAISDRSGRRREGMRRQLLPAMMRGETIDVTQSRLVRSIAADLTLELAELVRGSDREALVAAAISAGADQVLARRLRSHSAQERLVAAEALAMFPSHTDALAKVALNDRSPDVRLGAALALAQEGRGPPVGELVRALGIGITQHSLLAVSLMRDLVKIDPHAVEALLYDLTLSDEVKLAATDALAESGAVDHAPLVAWMAEAAGEDSDLQPRIFRALGRIGHPVGHDAILGGLDSPAWQVRASASEAAGRSALRTAVPRLAQLLDDDEWWVRMRAGEALARLGSAGILALHEAAIAPAPVARAAAKATLAERAVA